MVLETACHQEGEWPATAGAAAPPDDGELEEFIEEEEERSAGGSSAAPVRRPRSPDHPPPPTKRRPIADLRGTDVLSVLSRSRRPGEDFKIGSFVFVSL